MQIRGDAAVELGPDFNGNNGILVWRLGGSSYHYKLLRQGDVIIVSDLEESGGDLLITGSLGMGKMGSLLGY